MVPCSHLRKEEVYSSRMEQVLRILIWRSQGWWAYSHWCASREQRRRCTMAEDLRYPRECHLWRKNWQSIRSESSQGLHLAIIQRFNSEGTRGSFGHDSCSSIRSRKRVLRSHPQSTWLRCAKPVRSTRKYRQERPKIQQCRCLGFSQTACCCERRRITIW